MVDAANTIDIDIKRWRDAVLQPWKRRLSDAIQNLQEGSNGKSTEARQADPTSQAMSELRRKEAVKVDREEFIKRFRNAQNKVSTRNDADVLGMEAQAIQYKQKLIPRMAGIE
jgi:hypothetical protein